MKVRRTVVAWAAAAVAVAPTAAADPAVRGFVATGDVPMGMAVDEKTGKVYVVHQGSRDVAVVHPGERDRVERFGDGRWLGDVAVDEDRGRVYVLDRIRSEGDRSLLQVYGRDLEPLRTVELGRGPTAVAYSARLDRAYVANFHSETISLVGGATLRHRRDFAVLGHPVDAVAHDRSGVVYAATTEGFVYAFGREGVIARRRAVRRFDYPALAVDARRDRLYVTSEHTNSVVELDAGSLEERHRYAFGRTPVEVAVDEELGILATLLWPDFDADDGTDRVVFHDVRSRRTLGAADVGSATWDLAIVPRSWELIASDSHGGGVSVVAIDGAAPVASVDSSTGAVVDGGTPLTGHVSDDLSGMQRVLVRMRQGAAVETRRAALDCDERRRDCRWSTPAPGPGTYEVTVEPADAAGNVPAGPPSVVVTWLP